MQWRVQLRGAVGNQVEEKGVDLDFKKIGIEGVRKIGLM